MLGRMLPSLREGSISRPGDSLREGSIFPPRDSRDSRDRATPLLLSGFRSAQARACLLPHVARAFAHVRIADAPRARFLRAGRGISFVRASPIASLTIAKIEKINVIGIAPARVSPSARYQRCIGDTFGSLVSIDTVGETFRLVKSRRGIKSRYCSEDNSC